MLDPRLSRLAVAGVILLICFLAYASQLFLLHPHLSRNQTIFFNVLVGCIWITYARSIFTHPGSPPESWAPDDVTVDGEDAEEGHGRVEERRLVARGTRWCRKCEAFKPPRCHHCKTCKMCVLRMDHHCPWTNNCVGYRNLPHFIRFLFYCSITCAYLFAQLLQRGWAIWEVRASPSYDGPHTLPEMLLLTALLFVDLLVTFSLTVLYVRTLWSSAEGYTTIETWEQDRHDALVRRRRVKRQQFPYDIGFWDNLCSAHGSTGNILAWYWPFARSPEVGETVKGSGGIKLKGGVEWEVNGYEDLSAVWPPLDPDKVVAAGESERTPFMASGAALAETGDSWAEGVRRRQKEDLTRRNGYGGSGKGLDGLNVAYEMEEEGEAAPLLASRRDRAPEYPRIANRKRWTNNDGETLADYGVDEDAENADEDVPLAELIRRRKAQKEQ